MRSCKRRLMEFFVNLRDFRHSQDGVAAVEFAFIAPVMIVMLMGVFEAGRAYSMFRSVSHAADMVGDLVTRDIAITNQGTTGPHETAISDIYALVTATMGTHPFNPNLKIDIVPLVRQQNEISVYAKPPGFRNGKQAPAGGDICSYQPTSDERAVLQTTEARNGVTGLVVVRTTYDYKPLLLQSVSIPWEYKQIFVPRRAACVRFDVTCGQPHPQC